MAKTFLLYGANGYVGEAAARLAVATGLQPIIAGRNETSLKNLAVELGVEYRVFDLNDPMGDSNPLAPLDGSGVDGVGVEAGSDTGSDTAASRRD